MKLNKQSGFTLIELVMVIVILGILAATALPKFIDLKSDAQTAATSGVAGALGAAHAVNYAGRSANSLKGVSVGACNSTGLADVDTTKFSISSTTVANGATVSCTVTGGAGTSTSSTATFTGYGIT